MYGGSINKTTIIQYIELRDVDGFFIESEEMREDFKFIIETCDFAVKNTVPTHE